MAAMRYSFDTSSLLNGQRDLLPPAVFPTLWERIEELVVDGTIRAVDVVRDELSKRDDAVKEWAKAHRDLFVSLDSDIQAATSALLAAHPKLMGRGGGRNAADPFVIGLAMARGGTVVSEESFSGRLDKPRIPDVCQALNVPQLTLVEFVREQGWTF